MEITSARQAQGLHADWGISEHPEHPEKWELLNSRRYERKLKGLNHQRTKISHPSYFHLQSAFLTNLGEWEKRTVAYGHWWRETRTSAHTRTFPTSEN